MAQPSATDRLAAATLNLAGKSGWTALTAAQLAKTAKVPTQVATDFLAQPCTTLRDLADYITRLVAQDYHPDPQATPRDALFELLMLRFDILQKYRRGILALIHAARRDPALALALAASMPPQITVMLEQAKITPITPLHQPGLLSIYAATLHVWQQDNSHDLARTMATLDGHLRRTEKLLQKFSPKSP